MLAALAATLRKASTVPLAALLIVAPRLDESRGGGILGDAAGGLLPTTGAGGGTICTGPTVAGALEGIGPVAQGFWPATGVAPTVAMSAVAALEKAFSSSGAGCVLTDHSDEASLSNAAGREPGGSGVTGSTAGMKLWGSDVVAGSYWSERQVSHAVVGTSAGCL
jgi:hypothetical protein